MSPAQQLRLLLSGTTPIMAPGVYDGLSARCAEAAGFDVLYMSGFSVAGATFGKPDIGLLTADDMGMAAARITDVTNLPLIADADNGYGGPGNVARVVQRYEQYGVACAQIEDQVHPKRCGHMEGKAVVSRTEALEKIAAAADVRTDMLIMARTDARATHDLDEALVRGELFLDAGADILFVEAPADEAEIRTIGAAFPETPLVLNLVEEGKTPWITPAAATEAGFRIILYPVTALLHVAHTLTEVYRTVGQHQGQTPMAGRDTFGGFNDRVGLSGVNTEIDSLRVRVDNLVNNKESK